jgi:hypothetical protein
MICSESRPLLAYLPLEALDDDEAAPLEGHLAECVSCRATADALEASYLEVGRAQRGEDAPVPATLWDRIATEIESEREEKATDPKSYDLAIALVCTFCHDALVRGDASYCASCLAPHHSDCFVAHGTCSAPGCEETHTVRPQLEVNTGRKKKDRWGTRVGLGVAACLAGSLVAAVLYDGIVTANNNRVVSLQKAAESLHSSRQLEVPAESDVPTFQKRGPSVDGPGLPFTRRGPGEQPELIVPRQPKVLILEGIPRFEFRYLKNVLLERFAAQSFLTATEPEFVQESSKGVLPLASIPDLGGYDVVVLGDLRDQALVGSLELERFVSQGGGLVLVPGDFGLAGLGDSVEDLAPVVDEPLDSTQKTVNSFSLPTVGHPSMAGLWDHGKLRPLGSLSSVRPARLRSGAETLLAGPGDRPVIATWNVGAGKVVYLAGDDFWRWRSEQELGGLTYKRFWTDLVVWAGLQPR